jgi:GTPase SAR1 family protein
VTKNDFRIHNQITARNALLAGSAGSGRHCLRFRICKGRYVDVQELYSGAFANDFGAFVNDFDVSTQIRADSTGKGVEMKTRWWIPGYKGDSPISITSTSYRNRNCVLVIVDVTDRSSFEQAAHKLDRSEPNGFAREAPSQCIFAVVATKFDILDEERKVSAEEIKKLATEYNALFFQVSALTGSGVEEMIQELMDLMLRSPPIQQEVSNSCFLL